jgi:hypothetical protein
LVILDPEDGGNMFLRNIRWHPPAYTASSQKLVTQYAVILFRCWNEGDRINEMCDFHDTWKIPTNTSSENLQRRDHLECLCVSWTVLLSDWTVRKLLSVSQESFRLM